MRVRKELKPSFWPLVKIRCRWRMKDSYMTTRFVTRWFLFGVIPVWQKRERVE